MLGVDEDPAPPNGLPSDFPALAKLLSAGAGPPLPKTLGFPASAPKPDVGADANEPKPELANAEEEVCGGLVSLDVWMVLVSVLEESAFFSSVVEVVYERAVSQ